MSGARAATPWPNDSLKRMTAMDDLTATPGHEFEDPVGNKLTVEALLGGTAVIRWHQQPGEQPCVIITPAEARAIADAVQQACHG